jgi:uncharacterized protein YdeI (YjbR/CyaY-like superfamily)
MASGAGRRSTIATTGRDDGASAGRAAPTEDFAAAPDAVPAARAFFDSLRSAQRYAFLYRLRNIKRRETRAERLAEYVRMLAERRTLHD